MMYTHAYQTAGYVYVQQQAPRYRGLADIQACSLKSPNPRTHPGLSPIRGDLGEGMVHKEGSVGGQSIVG